MCVCVCTYLEANSVHRASNTPVHKISRLQHESCIKPTVQSERARAQTAKTSPNVWIFAMCARRKWRLCTSVCDSTTRANTCEHLGIPQRITMYKTERKKYLDFNAPPLCTEKHLKCKSKRYNSLSTHTHTHRRSCIISLHTGIYTWLPMNK